MTYKRIISGLLALSMTASMMPTAIADTNSDNNTNNENTNNNSVTINNENNSGQMVLTLNVKGTLDLSLEMADWAYKSEASEPVLTGNTGNGDVTYYYKPQGADDDAYTTEKPTAEGAYTVKAEVAETEGYYGGTATADFNIKPLTAGMEINLKVKKTITRDDYEVFYPESLVYDSQAKELSVQNLKDDMAKPTIEYYKDDVNLNGAPVDAGDYMYKVIFPENEEYKAASFMGNFAINRADAQVTAPKAINGLVFDGDVHELVEAGSTKSGKIKYRIVDVDMEQPNVENDWQTIIPTAKDAGEYQVEWRVFDADENNWNVEPDSGLINVNIARATATVEAPKAINGLVFNGTKQALVEAGSTSGGVMEYKVDEGEWSADLPEATDAGDHFVYYRVNFGDDAENWNEVETDPIVVNIDNTFTVTWKNGDKTIETDELVEFGTEPSYDGEEPAMTGEDNEVFVFSGWDKDIDEVTEDVTLNATFKKYTRTDAKEETCEEDGNTVYYTGDDGFYYTYDGTDFAKIEENSWIIEAKGHNYNVRPIWEWNEEWSEATATFVCANDSEHTVVLNADITESITAGKIGEKGEHIIVATVEFNGRKYTNHKITKMPATTVKKIAAKDATCSEEGNIEYYAGSDGKFYVFENGEYVEIAIEDTVIPVNDVHTFGEPTFVWGEKNTATAVFKCNDCGYEESRDAAVELVKTAPTYTENGKYVYTASVEADGVVYTDSKEVTIYSPDPIDVTYTPGDKSVNLTWNAVDGAEKYGICIMENGQWKKIEEGYKTKYTLTGLQPDTKYTVTVIPMVQNIWCSDFTHAIEVQANSELPAGFPKVETQVSGSKFKLDWTAVDGAEKYGIAVYQGGKWVVKATVNGDVTSFTSPEVAAGTYKMVVCAKVNGKWDTRALNSRAFGVTIE
ncbi:hypothetical protein [Ruminococcus sp.]|uniref:hypothetical protein n=1 Tax=Ruminococcus sp. TaxID=41978 RepID=UPI001B21CB91|nr:hypothetical protein [Ruminococcus sp.]MBO5558148.1 fibronectin type III domain-containing protein [Ruminococcus sp.]